MMPVTTIVADEGETPKNSPSEYLRCLPYYIPTLPINLSGHSPRAAHNSTSLTVHVYIYIYIGVTQVRREVADLPPLFPLSIHVLEVDSGGGSSRVGPCFLFWNSTVA
eukprot:GHVU01151310.1.p1 GENE.GHVU01151310.1~~GHVU01151310.1.p1  ORF type:complete len:108 (-),score=4.53 GHVU01151310.1:354-677(-)